MEPLRVAVADDECDVRDFLERVLPRMGLQVVGLAENGRELLELCRATLPDLIISDLRMPELDGDEAVRQFGGAPTTPFIALSAFSQPADFALHLTPGRWIYLRKPVRSVDLEAAIRKLFPELCAPSHPRRESIRAERPSAKVSGPRRSTEILLVDDDEEFRGDLAGYLQRQGYHVAQAGDGEAALELAKRQVFDIVILDLMLPGTSGIDVLRQLKHSGCESDFVVLSGQGTIEYAVEAIKSGAVDFLTKPVRLEALERVVRRAGETMELKKENQELRAVLATHRSPRTLIGESRAMREVHRLVERAGPTDKPVLVLGESGTGKELVAAALHEASPLRDRPLVVVNCAALPESLLESELFGHEQGAFTGANRAKPGLFEIADGGTLFIDEIGELALPLQAKLLRVLEDGSLRRIGSVKQRRVRVRIIAATNRDLADEVRAGRFRDDLYYRINVLSIELPPLRMREGDLPELVRHFLGPEWRLAPDVLPALLGYPWPGNVRQLINSIERATILAEDDLIQLENFPPEVVRFARGTPERTAPPANSDLDALTRFHVLAAFERCGRNKARTARALGINRRSLYRLLEKYGG